MAATKRRQIALKHYGHQPHPYDEHIVEMQPSWDGDKWYDSRYGCIVDQYGDSRWLVILFRLPGQPPIAKDFERLADARLWGKQTLRARLKKLRTPTSKRTAA